MEADIEREVQQHMTWTERVKDWKKLNAELAVKQFTCAQIFTYLAFFAVS